MAGTERIGVCLPGGGAKGASQAGALHAMHDLKIPVSAISGASVGSLNGALFAQGTIERLEHVWATIKKRNVYRRFPAAFCPWRGYRYDTRPLDRLIRETVDLDLLAAGPRLFIRTVNELTGETYTAEPEACGN